MGVCVVVVVVEEGMGKLVRGGEAASNGRAGCSSSDFAGWLAWGVVRSRHPSAVCSGRERRSASLSTTALIVAWRVLLRLDTRT